MTEWYFDIYERFEIAALVLGCKSLGFTSSRTSLGQCTVLSWVCTVFQKVFTQLAVTNSIYKYLPLAVMHIEKYFLNAKERENSALKNCCLGAISQHIDSLNLNCKSEERTSNIDRLIDHCGQPNWSCIKRFEGWH